MSQKRIKRERAEYKKLQEIAQFKKDEDGDNYIEFFDLEIKQYRISIPWIGPIDLRDFNSKTFVYPKIGIVSYLRITMLDEPRMGITIRMSDDNEKTYLV